MKNAQEHQALAEAAIQFARIGGATAKRYLGSCTVSMKSDETPVTDADHAVQAAIMEGIASRFPSHAVLVEEDLAKPHRHAATGVAQYCWVVDPIDGTRNFARGIGAYATSVAVLFEGRPIAAAVHDAISGRTFHARRHGGAYCEDQRLPQRDAGPESDAVVLISSFRRRAIPASVPLWMDRYVFRNYGSLCLHLVWVAAGTANAAYALECKPWDVAAGALIIEEAGGRITDHSGGSLWPMKIDSYANADTPILAGTPSFHAKLLLELGDDAK